MLRLFAKHGATYKPPGWHSGYNEVVVQGDEWNSHLPRTVEAFFLLKGADARHGDAARGARRAFLEAYGLRAYDVPLLEFDPANWRAPFRFIE